MSTDDTERAKLGFAIIHAAHKILDKSLEVQPTEELGPMALWLNCLHCKKPITHLDTDAVMIRELIPGRPVYRGVGPFHAECAGPYQDKNKGDQ